MYLVATLQFAQFNSEFEGEDFLFHIISKIASIYDDVVEKRLLSNTFFTLPLAFLDSWTYRTARRVFVELLTSAEAYFLTESVLIKFSSLQLLISTKRLAQKWGHRHTVHSL